MMTCTEPDGIMDQEAAYMAALQSAASFQFDGNRLTLRRLLMAPPPPSSTASSNQQITSSGPSSSGKRGGFPER